MLNGIDKYIQRIKVCFLYPDIIDLNNNEIDDFQELFSINVDEFVKVEILKFLSRFRHDNRETKDKIVKLIVEKYIDNEEMTLSIAAQMLTFFDLGKEDFRKISNFLLDKEYQNMDMIDLTSSLIRLLCAKKNRSNGSDEYFQELEKIDSYRDDIKTWAN